MSFLASSLFQKKKSFKATILYFYCCNFLLYKLLVKRNISIPLKNFFLIGFKTSLIIKHFSMFYAIFKWFKVR